MEELLYQKIFKDQEEHWFFAAKRQFFDALLAEKVERNGALSIADVGCGTGTLFSYLKQFGSVVGLDISGRALSFAKKISREADVGLVRAKAEEIPLKDNIVDIACLSDVLYHKDIFSDKEVLKECFRILRPKGMLILSDSAFKILKGPHDVAAGGRRRYSIPEIRAKLEGSGFSVKRASYTYMSLFPAVLALRTLKRIWHKNTAVAQQEFNPLPYLLNSIINLIFFLEAIILRFINFPFGLSVMAIAVKL